MIKIEPVETALNSYSEDIDVYQPDISALQSDRAGPEPIFVDNATTFNSTTSRGLLHYEIDEYQPDAGQYFNAEIEAVPAKITHSVFKSKTQRFVANNHPKTPCPGPSDYDVRHETIGEKIRKKNLNKAIHDVIARHPASVNKQPLNGTNQMVSISKNPPSIPYGETAHGYETTFDGKLVPRTPPIVQAHSREMEMATNHGVGWSKSKTQRFSEPSTNTEDVPAVQSTINRWVNQQHEDQLQVTDFIQRRSSISNETSNDLQKLEKQAKSTNNGAFAQKLQRIYAQKVNALQNATSGHKANKVLADRALNNEKMESFVFKSTSKRFQGLVKDDGFPGPGQYNIAPPPAVPSAAAPKSSLFKKEAVSPRGHHHEYPAAQQDRGGAAALGPGPGAYDIPSTFKSMDDIHAENIQLGLPPKAPFLSTVGKFAERVQETASITPGPGFYGGSIMNDVAAAHKPRIKYYKAPFGQHGDCGRNEGGVVKDGTVGPGQYDIAMSSYLMAPNRLKFGATAVFKSTSDRLHNANRGKAAVPGVGAYDLMKGRGPENEETPHNIYRFETKKEKPFISSTERFAESKYAVKTPGVGHYDTANAAAAAAGAGGGGAGGTKRRAGRFKGNSERPVPFGTTKRRFRQRGIGMLGPGPNAYSVVKRDSFVTKTFNCTYG